MIQAYYYQSLCNHYYMKESSPSFYSLSLYREWTKGDGFGEKYVGEGVSKIANLRVTFIWAAALLIFSFKTKSKNN